MSVAFCFPPISVAVTFCWAVLLIIGRIVALIYLSTAGSLVKIVLKFSGFISPLETASNPFLVISAALRAAVVSLFSSDVPSFWALCSAIKVLPSFKVAVNNALLAIRSIVVFTCLN